MNNKGYIVCNDELYHYGIPGMKWGRRKAQEIASNVRTSRIKRLQEKEKVAKQRRAQREKMERISNERKFVKPSKLTQEEMNQKIKRMQLEQRYIETARKTKQIESGKKRSDGYLKKLSKDIGGRAATYYAYKGANAMLSKLDKAVDPVLGYDPKAFRPVGSPYFDKGNKDNNNNNNKKK